ncbi:MAG: formylglycine-generating enzyme family protein [Isosphaeraceae bacterium]
MIHLLSKVEVGSKIFVRQAFQPDDYTVGQKRPNGFGLYDMHGNLVEWCSDVFDSDFYMKSPRENPLLAYEIGERVYRGGDFNSSASECRSASCGGVKPELRHYRNGFRLARSRRSITWQGVPGLPYPYPRNRKPRNHRAM